MSISFGARSDVGKVRTNNEDNFFVDEKMGLFLVADGMGGANAGEVASKMAMDVISANMKTALARQESAPDKTQVILGQNNPGISPQANHLASSIRLANQVINEASAKYTQNQGMGTTVVAVLEQKGSYSIAWVGDSRIYLVRHNQVQQLSTDHSLVQEQVTQGLITPEVAKISEFKNILTRALGTAPSVEVSVEELPAFDRDYLILCSDGLTRKVTDDMILAAVQEATEPQKIADRLVALANELDGKDNVTVVTVHYKTDTILGKFKNLVGKK
jgi:protein phosphatase